YALWTSANSGAVVGAQHIRGNSGDSNVADTYSEASSTTTTGNRKAHRKTASNLIEIKDQQGSNQNRRFKVTQHQVEQELVNIFTEDADHWDRMLQVDSFVPTKPPATVAPTDAPIAPTDEPVSDPTEPPSVAPVSAPVVTVAPTEMPTVGAPTAPTPRPTALPATTWDILLSKPEEFSILIAASEAVGFDEALQNDEDRTIFAPNNTAFANLMPEDLLDKYFDFEKWTDEYISRLLFCHDIAGSIIFSFQFQNGTKVLPCLDFVDPAFTITTPPLQISKATMPVPANIVQGDLLAQNGVIHVIDQVMTTSYLRLDLPQALAAFGGFSILLDLLTITGLDGVLSGPGPFTVFAPTDEVFESYGEQFLKELQDDPDALTEVLLNHVVADVIIPCCDFDGLTFESAAGYPIVLQNVDDTEPRNFTVNGVPNIPILTNGLSSNGKINAITDLLFPPSVTATPVAPIPEPSAAPIDEPSTGTTWDLVKSRPEEFATFIVASEAVGFDTILQESTDRTVFVPNEAAFESVIPPDLLAKYFDFDVWSKEYLEVLLFCHELTDSVVLSTDLTNGTELILCLDLIDPVAVITLPPPQLSKETMPVPANIVEVDLVADNGVVHVIDQVITNSFLRYNFVDAATFAGGYSILLELIDLTGLSDVATGPDPFTIFAPPDELFESYGQGFIDGLKGDINGTRTILLNHIVPGMIIPCCLGEMTVFFSAAGEALILDEYNPNNPSDYTVNGISTISSGTDLLTSNAKVNTISDFLLPGAGVPTASPSETSLVPTSVATTFVPTSSGTTFLPTLGDTSLPPGSEAPSSTVVPSLDDTSVPPDSEAPSSTNIPSLGDTSVAPGTDAPTPSSNPAFPPDTVWDIIAGNADEFSTLIAAAEAVGYDQILQSDLEVTLFAPNDQAFENLLPPDLLVKYFDTDAWTNEYILQLLTCHDIDGAAILSSDLTNGAEFATCYDLLDPEFIFTSPPPQIGKETMPVPATIVGADQESLNGVVHVVDQVLTTSFLRYNVPEAMEALENFSVLLELIVLTDLLDFVEGDGPFTIFAPPDLVFGEYGQEFVDNLKMDMEGTRDLLLNHVVPDEIVGRFAFLDGAEFTSAAGFPLVLDGMGDVSSPGAFTVNEVATLPYLTNFLTSNAKINAISDFLLPPNLS
ncbi:MAG: hypothetical protein SGILL_000587, partial [Bacillariaceae sp.]